MSAQHSTAADLSALARPSGGFAMVALDQRESMRAMFAEHQAGPVSDEQVTEFKVAAGRSLGPYASAVLVDPAVRARPLPRRPDPRPDNGPDRRRRPAHRTGRGDRGDGGDRR